MTTWRRTTRRRPSRRAVVVGVAWLTAVTGSVALVVGARSLPGYEESGFSIIFAGLALAAVTNASVGAILSLRSAGNVVGRLLLVAANLIPLTFLGFVYGGILTQERGERDLAAGLASLIGALGIFPTVVAAGPLVALIFPDGRFRGPRWRWAAIALLAVLAIGSLPSLVRPGPVGDSLADNPLGLDGVPWLDGASAIGTLVTGVAESGLLFLALASIGIGFRRSRGVERQQLKWFMAANAALGILLSLSLADGATNPTIFDNLAIASLSLPPVAIGIAVTRYRLFELDRIISRTIGWAIVTGLLAAIYLIGVLVLQSALAGITQGQTLAVAGSTLLAYAAFQPARRRIQRLVDRRFDRARYDGERTVVAFSNGLRGQVDLPTISVQVVAAVDAAVRPTGTTVWLREPAR